MGIRFRCPNGHKIHVKAFLAGKRGICPDCGIRVPIPAESDREFAGPAHPSDMKRQVPSGEGSEAGSGESAAARLSAQQTAMHQKPVAQKPIAQSAPSGQVLEPNLRPSHRAAEGSASASKSEIDALPVQGGRSTDAIATNPIDADPIDVDPIDAVPNAKWFVRPPSGGQFGPAPGHILRSWIAEGRVTLESELWREGWSHWVKAERVIKRIGHTAGESAEQDAVPSVVAATASKSSSELYRRRQTTKMTTTVVFLLGLACAILFVALVYVVRFM